MKLRLLVAVLALSGLLTGCTERFDIENPIGFAVAFCGLIGVGIWRSRGRRARLRYSRVDLTAALPRTPRTVLRHVPAALRAIAMLSLAIAVGRPQWEEFDERTVEGIDIFLVLDMSGSMRAVDLSNAEIVAYQQQYRREPPNRFESAIATLQGFVGARERDRIGMVVFARDAYLQFPLTLDYGTIQTLLSRLRLDAIDASATAIGNALGLGVRGLMNSDASSRAIILITDGKQQGGNISPMRAAEIASDEGIRMYPILVGREGPALVPVNLRMRGGMQRYRQEDYPIDPELLQEIATLTDGSFYRAERPEQLENDLNAILNELERSQMRDISSVNERELFGGFVWFALACLVLEALMAWLFVRRLP